MKTMSDDGKFKLEQPVFQKIAFVLLGAGLLLLVPFVAMQFTDEVKWDVRDFLTAGGMLVGTGVAYILGARIFQTRQAKIARAIALGLALFLVWAELAVGLFGTPFAGS